MNWNNPDAYPGESEDEYIARKNGESQSATGLMFVVSKVFIFVLKIFAVFGVFLYTGNDLDHLYVGISEG
ncbi:hypothetical protein [Sphingobacterium composti Ten et al. 2007 non Yoo et al. 2007]|uniref:hypothetical protein n=1 Tax=Sphingobacterium composti TaxID=363260 RepID=UPI00135882F2|nr:hypothetical protein [Sphingobacterium composti Ten et al. 2007 non Yoo et al. 2007]